jgi:pimeloyl-ACP methyl ester carboxylesterase/DNA-binding SARP family transcriptional activator
MRSSLQIGLLGELNIRRGGAPVPLPASRKSRALLGYLALTARPHRRERLCEILWDLPDDPRGSLRWALSKIRQVVDDEERARVIADRERVALALEDVPVDIRDIRHRLEADAQDVSLCDLHAMAESLAQPLLDGLDMPQSEVFHAWLTGEREEALKVRLSVLQRITLHPETSDHDAVRWVRDWHRSDPVSADAAGILARTLKRIGRVAEAEEVAQGFRRTIAEAGLARLPDLLAEEPPATAQNDPGSLLRRQEIGFCRSCDGVRIAYACVGNGPPLVKAANWLNHLELDWTSPIWSKTFQALSDGRRFIRYDERGNGLSDWDVGEIGFEAFVRDLEAVVDSLGLERFPLLGMSQGCAVSIDYAVRHPERVSALILLGGYPAGWRIGASPEERERREAVMTLTRLGWGTNNAAYRHIFSQTFMPDGTPDELAWFDEFQRQTTSPENAVRFQDAFGDIDVRALLPRVTAPTLVLHARHDQRITLDQGRELAIGIPGARLVVLESRSHIILGHEPAWSVCMAEIERFLEASNDEAPGRLEHRARS